MPNDRKVIYFSGPIQELVNNIKEHLLKQMIIIYGRCTATFDGRIKSTLDVGDRLLIIKPDTSLLLHGLFGVKPLNWQLPNAGDLFFRAITTSFIEDSNEDFLGGMLELYTYRPKTKESFIIVFELFYIAYACSGTDQAQMVIEGDEYDMQDYLIKNPHLLEHGLKILSREYESLVGKIDLVGLDIHNNAVYIEVKKGKITPADTFQIVRYRDIIQKTRQNMDKVRTILVGAGISEKLKYFLVQQKIEFIEIKWNEIFPSIARTKPKSLQEFF